MYSGGRQRVSLLPDRVRKDNGGGRGHGGSDDEVVEDEVEATRLRIDDGRAGHQHTGRQPHDAAACDHDARWARNGAACCPGDG